ncbi:RidA family protein [Christensenellaceae bacterium OttesenSCG-928-L17]|nr:RidA family protein [Christensenellaceae bacterium OttesenSCG-928-L17]
MKTIITAKNAPAALGPYNHAIEANGFVFTSGQLGIDPATGKMPEDVEAQAKQAFSNLAGVLEAAGCTLKDVVKCMVFLQNIGDFAAVNAIYAEAYGSEFPARSCVEVAKLPGGALVEIEAIAVRP